MTQRSVRPSFNPRLLAKGVAFALFLCPVGAAAAGGKTAAGVDSPFIAQSQVAATVMVSFRPAGMLQVDMGLLVPNQAQRARVTALQPILRSTWRRATQEFANSYFVPGRVPDAVLLGQRLQAATDQVLGPNVGRVMLASVLVR